MNGKTVLAMVACAALGLAAAGCNGDNTNANANANTANANNANRANVNNANAANANNANTANHNGNATNWNMSREEYEKNANNYRSEAKNKGESVGDSIEDGWIHFKVRAALAAVDDLRDSTINVDVDKNVVTLRGSVAGADQKKKAEDAAKKVDGVKSVTNKLTTQPTTSANSNGRTPANTNR